MKKKIMAAVAAAGLALAFAVPAASAEGVESPGKNKDALIEFYGTIDQTGSPATESGYVETLGGAISGGFYGNTANSGMDSDAPASGNGVTAPASPGPTVGGCAAGPGASLGYAITGNGPDAVPQGNIPDRC